MRGGLGWSEEVRRVLGCRAGRRGTPGPVRGGGWEQESGLGVKWSWEGKEGSRGPAARGRGVKDGDEQLGGSDGDHKLLVGRKV